MVTSRSRFEYFLKPGDSISTVYFPTGSVGKTYSPRMSLTAVRVTLVACTIAVIFAPPITAPDGSFTVPRITPVVCASAQWDETNARTATIFHCLLIVDPPFLRD